MDVTPGNPPKRTRAKSASQPAAAKPPRKTLTASRKKAAEPEPEIIAETLTVESVGSGDLRAMIETAAFYRAAARGFTPGHELDDWLAAERQVLANSR